MHIPFDVQNTIETRRSARSFRADKLDAGILADIEAFSRDFPVPFAHETAVRFFEARSAKDLYPMMKAPPDNVAFLSETDAVSLSKTGFVGELVILYAHSKGVATCWYGHYRLAALEALMPHLQSAEQLGQSNMGFGYAKSVAEGIRAICISPLGYYEGRGLRVMDRITAGTISFRRKPVDALLCEPDEIRRLPQDMLYALDLGRKAPSAANAQMWRFGFEDEYRTVTVATPVHYRHVKWEHPDVDIGICASHIWLGLADRGHDPRVRIAEQDGRAVWRISI
jgi:nitroreductase